MKCVLWVCILFLSGCVIDFIGLPPDRADLSIIVTNETDQEALDQAPPVTVSITAVAISVDSVVEDSEPASVTVPAGSSSRLFIDDIKNETLIWFRAIGLDNKVLAEKKCNVDIGLVGFPNSSVSYNPSSVTFRSDQSEYKLYVNRCR